MSSPTLTSGPHVHSIFNVPRTMLAVMVCLFPATAFGLYQFGWPSVFLFLVTVASAWLFEVLSLLMAGRPVARFAGDGSALLTGWLVALTLPPWAPWWVGVTGAFVAIVIGKQVFGGLGQNLFNPAMVARAVLLVALPVQMTTWVAPLGMATHPGFLPSLTITFGAGAPVDAVSSASVLGHLQSALNAGQSMASILSEIGPIESLFYGHASGSLGEINSALLLAGGLGLVLLRIITPIIPIAVLGALYVAASLANLIDPTQFPPATLHLSSGATMLAAFFIATDYVTSPTTPVGRAIYGLGIGLLIFVIRTWGAFPEGVAFAVLLMNACTPLIDTYVRPRIFGRTRSGKPIELRSKP